MAAQGDVNFQAVYEGKESAQNVPWVPWNIDEPQPKIAELEPKGYFRSEVLDAGCGVGDTTMFLASRGYTAVGLDAAPAAISAAKSRAAERGIDTTFDVADLTALQGYKGRFKTVVDSGTLPAITHDRRSDYLATLAASTTDDARYIVLTFSHEAKAAMPVGPALFTEQDLRALIGKHWTVDTLTASTITAKLAPGKAEEALGADEHGRVLVPAWLVIAHK